MHRGKTRTRPARIMPSPDQSWAITAQFGCHRPHRQPIVRTRCLSANRHLARGHAGHQSDGNPPVGGGRKKRVRAWPSMPGQAVLDGGTVVPSGGDGWRGTTAPPSGEDDGAHAAQEDAGALPQAQHQVAQARQTVGRQLQHQGLVAALHPDAPEYPGHGHGRPARRPRTGEQTSDPQVEGPMARSGDEGADQQRIHRQTRRTGHQQGDRA